MQKVIPTWNMNGLTIKKLKMKFQILIILMLSVLHVSELFSQSKDNSSKGSQKQLTQPTGEQMITIPLSLFDSMSYVMADYDLLVRVHQDTIRRIVRRDNEIIRKEGVILDQMAQKREFKRLDSLCEVSNRKKDEMLTTYMRDYKQATSFSPLALSLSIGYGVAALPKPVFAPVASLGISYTIIRFKRKS